MKETLRALLTSAIESLRTSGALPADLVVPAIAVDRTKTREHGDFATNIAMALAKPAKSNPRALAQQITNALPANDDIAKVEIAGPGFITIFLSDAAWQREVVHVLSLGTAYGRSTAGNGVRVGVEYVSANPTGPLHVGHGRAAAIGDTLARLLAATGWQVVREFYYNDAGAQIDNLAKSVQARCKGVFPGDPGWPEDGYRGEYILDLARNYLLGKPAKSESGVVASSRDPNDLDAIRRYAVAALRAEQNDDLGAFGVGFDVFFLESSLYGDGQVEATVAALKAGGHTYEQDGALWLRTTDFGDDKDRVMRNVQGRIHLLRAGRRLSFFQVAARLCARDHRARRRPPRHPHEGARRPAGARARHPEELAGIRAAPDGHGDARRRGSEAVQTCWQLSDLALPDR